ncbi:MAG TPA: ABC transporter transmembrane domain-containing protein, partial [Phycisphaerae bacterium]|nr:ABC transporter transmembrane domain-containing protein [Phycisphaerae bacterium]
MHDFRRALTWLRPHRGTLFIGLLMAVGVSVFYTFSVSSVVPLLKVIFAEHETLADWLHRAETGWRLGVVLAADLPDNPAGLEIDDVRPDSPSAGLIRTGDRIVAHAGGPLSAYDVTERIAQERDDTFTAVVEHRDGSRAEVTLRLRPYRWWSEVLQSASAVLPRGADADSRLGTLMLVMAALVVVSLMGGACRFFNEGLVATAVQRAMHDLRSRLAEHVLRLPVEWHANQPPGDTLGRFATDLGKVEIGVSTLFGKVIREPLKAVGVLALTLAIDWRLLLVALLGLPVGAVVMRVFGRLVKRSQKRASHSWGRLLDHLGEKLAGIRIVKAYNMERDESRRFEQEGRTLTRAQTQIELVDAATNPALELLAVLGVAAFVMYGASRVFSNQLEPHLFFAAVVCLGGIFDPVRKMGNVYNRLQQADVSARRLFELLDLAEERRRDAARPPRELTGVRQGIEFRDVCFAYPSRPDRPVLEHVNLVAPRGRIVALVGPNGSGKTTLISLLMRFYEPTSGQILIDGVDIREFTLESLRAHIGLVTQEAVVFSDSVRGNVAYGANGVPIETVRSAARLAHVDDFINTLRTVDNGHVLSGYEALITARALSGGQRQRIALARAILR